MAGTACSPRGVDAPELGVELDSSDEERPWMRFLGPRMRFLIGKFSPGEKVPACTTFSASLDSKGDSRAW